MTSLEHIQGAQGEKSNLPPACQPRVADQPSSSQPALWQALRSTKSRCRSCVTMHLLSGALCIYAISRVASAIPQTLRLMELSSSWLNLVPFLITTLAMVAIGAPMSLTSLLDAVKLCIFKKG